MSSAPPNVAISAVNNSLSMYPTGEAQSIFKDVKVPIIAVNGDLDKTDIEANRRHMYSFDTVIIKIQIIFLCWQNLMNLTGDCRKQSVN